MTQMEVPTADVKLNPNNPVQMLAILPLIAGWLILNAAVPVAEGNAKALLSYAIRTVLWALEHGETAVELLGGVTA